LVAVSVIIPTFNRPDKLRRAIGSVLSQTLEDLEILVINDSNEESPVLNVINDLKDTRIKYFCNEMTKGGNGARNTGISRAKGKYLAFLDDDDEWMPKKLEAQVQRLESLDDPSWGGCYCGYTILEGNHWRNELHLLEGDFLREFLLGKCSIGSTSTLIINSDAMKKVMGFDEKLERHQDIHFLVKFFRYFKLAFVDEVLVKVYGHTIPSAIKLEQAKARLFELISDDIAQLTQRDIRYLFASHYRDLSILFALEGDKEKYHYYFSKSLSYKIMSPIRYVKVILALIDNKLDGNLIFGWHCLRSRIIRIIGTMRFS